MKFSSVKFTPVTRLPRLMIAGVRSGGGKTTLALGIMAALRRRGLQVQPYKAGPDYVDPGLHYAASGVKSHNLDGWMSSEQVIKTIFLRNSPGCDISVVEGVMGLFDGAKGQRLKGSSAHLALVLDLPVVLVADVRGMGRSCLALIKGFKEFEPRLNLCGVILNNAGGDYYRKVIKGSIEDELGIKVLGCLPKNRQMVMPHRHLGLLPAGENEGLDQAISVMADMVEAEIDLDSVIGLANSAGGLEHREHRGTVLLCPPVFPQARIGVARDQAFCFYYQDSLDYLRELGAELHYFSPLHDSAIPRVDGLYIGGGYPEMFLDRLAGNASMMASIRDAFAQGMPVFAEGGGLIYLAREIKRTQGDGSFVSSYDVKRTQGDGSFVSSYDVNKATFPQPRNTKGNTKEPSPCVPGVGLVPARVQMGKKLAALGYVEATAVNNSVVASKGDILKGHEFRYAIISGLKEKDSAYSLVGGKGLDLRTDGYAKGNLAASGVHLHLRSNPGVAVNFAQACCEYRGKRIKT